MAEIAAALQMWQHRCGLPGQQNHHRFHLFCICGQVWTEAWCRWAMLVLVATSAACKGVGTIFFTTGAFAGGQDVGRQRGDVGQWCLCGLKLFFYAVCCGMLRYAVVCCGTLKYAKSMLKYAEVC